MIRPGRHSRLHFAATLSALLLAAGCGKVVPSGTGQSQVPVFFQSPETKALVNTSIGPNYDTREDFCTYAAFSEAEFDPAGSYKPFWDGGIQCSYNNIYLGWAPVATYYWPASGYLSFQAYSPADAPVPAFSWQTGFTWDDFTVPAAGLQYDLLYSNRVTNCRRSDYTPEGDSYDDDPDYEFIYKGVNLSFKHALSLIEVQASSALGSYSSIKYCIQKVVLHDAYYMGDFASSTQSWTTNTSAQTDYTLLDLSGETAPEDRWKVLPGSDEYPVSVHPDVALILLPQELAGTYLSIDYKCTADDVVRTTDVPLTGTWERGKKYTYKLVFSSDIEFSASISGWDANVTHGSYLIVQ